MELLQAMGPDPVLQRPAELERNRDCPAADDETAEPSRMPRRGEQCGRRADVGADDVRLLQPERVGDGEHELAHRSRGHQGVAALGVAEPRQVDRHQMGLLGELPPDRLEGQQRLRPRTEQQCVVVVAPALGEPDRQAVDDTEPDLERGVEPGGHPHLLRSGALCNGDGGGTAIESARCTV